MWAILIPLCMLSFFNHLFAASISGLQCDEPRWASPAQSERGIFRGDLGMTCQMRWQEGKQPLCSLELLRAGIVSKIQSDSIIHSGPVFSQDGPFVRLIWDVTQNVRDDGAKLAIREAIVLVMKQREKVENFEKVEKITSHSSGPTLPSFEELHYGAYSKDVKAEGMAQYLKTVNFDLYAKRVSKNHLSLELRNAVAVERPWFALDLVFAPIAKNICFKKMQLLKEELLPWIVELFNKSKTNCAATLD